MQEEEIPVQDLHLGETPRREESETTHTGIISATPGSNALKKPKLHGINITTINTSNFNTGINTSSKISNYSVTGCG